MSGAIKAIGSFFSAPKLDVPKAAKSIAMPDVNSAQARMESVKRLRARAKKGREGTIYSQSYSGANLAGTA